MAGAERILEKLLMTDVFVNLLLGHLVGDFVLQPKNMAVKKGASNLTAVAHVSIYTAAVALFTLDYHNFDVTKYYLWMLAIFIPHYLIDRYSLADKWLQFINGRSLEDFLHNGHGDIPFAYESDFYRNYYVLRGGFTSLVYAVTDNTFHLLCLWFGYKLIF